jgi:hypothetical protein
MAWATSALKDSWYAKPDPDSAFEVPRKEGCYAGFNARPFSRTVESPPRPAQSTHAQHGRHIELLPVDEQGATLTITMPMPAQTA